MIRLQRRLPAVLLLMTAASLGSTSLGADGAAGDPFLGRLARGRGVALDSAGRPARLGPEELRFYARFLALDPDSHPPRARVWMRLAPGGEEALGRLGVAVEGAAGALRSATVPLPALAGLRDHPLVEWIRVARRAVPELDASIPEIGADAAAAGYGARGAGAVVGVVDTGIDLQHGDFRRPDGSTRVKFFWNQAFNCGAPPAGFGYGCLYTESQINDALGGIGSVTAPDADGHGTHVAGVAAGDGSQTGNGQPAGTYVGVAPEADLIIVKAFAEPGSSTCFACDVGDGLAFIDQQAAAVGLPYVANLSLGHDMGGHDGSDAVEQVIDALTGPGVPGKAVVKSAGNNRGVAIHASGTLAPGGVRDHTFTVPTYTPAAGTFNDIQTWSMWYAAGDSFTVSIRGPRYPSPCPSCILSASTGMGFSAVGTADGVMIIDDFDSPAANGARFFEMEIDDQVGTAPRPGVWTFRVQADTVTQGGRYDLWIWLSSFGTVGLASAWDVPDPSMLLTIPGTAFDVTTVGGYLTKDEWLDIDGDLIGYISAPPVGALASFSSPGPTRDGRWKPELAAPAQGIAAALSDDAAPGVLGDPSARLLVVQDGQHWVLAGTSFSAPHVAGTYALLLGLDPGLDAAQLRSLVTSTARTDGFTGPGLPDLDWGSGKLDTAAAVERLVKPLPDLAVALDGTTFSWSASPLADSYNVYRGDLQLLDGAFYGTCLYPGLVAPSFSDASVPPAGGGFFYLATGVQDGIEGLLGFRSDGGVRPNGAPCP